MNKEPLSLYIFRFLTGFALFCFMCMLYWSSLIIEEDMRDIKNEINDLKKEVSGVRSEVESFEHSEIITTHENIKNTASSTSRSRIDHSLPNLLTEDPFYKTTLPNLLGEGFKPHGTFYSDSLGRPDNLHPFSNWASVSSWIAMCTGAVSTSHFGIFETYAPDLAVKMEERIDEKTKEPEYWIHLRNNAYWQPLNKEFFATNFKLDEHFFKKHQVTAHDFKFFYDALMNPFNQGGDAVALRAYYSELKEFRVIDDFTFVVKWKTKLIDENGKQVSRIKYIAKQWTAALRPLASFVYKYFPDGKKILDDDSQPDVYRTNSVWAQNFAQHWAKNVIPSCGGWVFTGLTDRQISFRRNHNYYKPLEVLAEEYEEQFKDSPDALWQDFEINKTDTYVLQPEQILEVERFLKSDIYKQQAAKGAGIKRIEYLGRRFNYIGWNQAKPFFKSKKVRQALTMAIDRKRIIRDILNGMGVEITGSFFKNSPSYDKDIIPWPYDPQKARQLLEEEGWFDSSGSGVIEKTLNGKRVPFKFSLTYFVKNQVSKSIGEYVVTALKEIGITCRLNGVDTADLSAAFDDKSFDAIILGWTQGSPPEDPKQLWSSSNMNEKGSSNAVGFSNAEVDQIIADLEYEYDPDKRIKLYHRFDRIIHEEQPYTFLFSPKTTLLYREYLQNVFIPSERQDLIPGANISEPQKSIFWIKK